MQLIAAPTSSRWEVLGIARSALAAVLLVLVGVLLAWVCLATPLVWSLVPANRPSAPQVVVGILGLAFAIVVPVAFIVLGLAKAAATIGTVAARRPRRPLAHLDHVLGPDHLAVEGLVLPDGRRVHELVLGPFGVVVLGDVPPPSMSRHIGRRWEIRDDRGRWLPIEPPVERTARDAERVRRWLGSHEHDFVVKVYAVVVADDDRVQRSPACAVVSPEELGPWLRNLPAQRGLNEARRGRVTDLVRAAMPTR